MEEMYLVGIHEEKMMRVKEKNQYCYCHCYCCFCWPLHVKQPNNKDWMKRQEKQPRNYTSEMGKLGKGDEKLLVKHVSCLEHEQEEEEELASLGD